MFENPQIPHILNFWEFIRDRKDNLSDKTAKEMADYFEIELDYAKELIQRYKEGTLINFYNLSNLFN